MEVWIKTLVEHYGISETQAKNLIEAGYITPKHIVKASDAKLLKVESIGQRALLKLREH